MNALVLVNLLLELLQGGVLLLHLVRNSKYNLEWGCRDMTNNTHSQRSGWTQNNKSEANRFSLETQICVETHTTTGFIGKHTQ